MHATVAIFYEYCKQHVTLIFIVVFVCTDQSDALYKSCDKAHSHTHSKINVTDHKNVLIILLRKCLLIA